MRSPLELLRRFRDGIARFVSPPIRTESRVKETDTAAVGTLNDGMTGGIAQTGYDGDTGRNWHVFMVDVDPVDDTEARVY